ncbi:phosphatase PAP2 family protein [Hymenobacter taeanensis]|uniref:Phosphatase PAP2 family protein n=1 Tax=Hymenobacter taeanensis TaxID=2735321 RepID=A0A6M6BNT2_9BACT|nr:MULTISPECIES: phosphatase PAP2 family protein [Hymenobacter]QJX48685.1 phosphatase PAP2 family protein [Hymenobacter taeanensis]UOQ81815.1 phosphatase PAP2 family protein [Hymenobacter sp. 5414T-23]
MIEYLQTLDRELLVAANAHHTRGLDAWMVFFSERFVWFPAYFVLLLVLGYLFRRRAFLLLPLLGLSVALADSVSSRFFKPYFARLRPCHDSRLSAVLNLANGCGGQFGFISSHAANAFALAVFIALVLPRRFRLAKILLFIWAAIVSYSRIYLAAHFPSDVVAGALLGSLLAWGCATLYEKGTARWWPTIAVGTPS